MNLYRRGFRLPQRSHLRTLKNFVSEKSGKRCEKSGKHLIKSGNRETLRRLIFFPVSAPVIHLFPHFKRVSFSPKIFKKELRKKFDPTETLANTVDKWTSIYPKGLLKLTNTVNTVPLINL